MSCPSAIHVVNANFSVPEGGGQVPLGSVVRRYGRNCQLNGGGINLVGAGYYDLDSTVTFTPTATGPVTVQFLQDGLVISGALATVNGIASEAVTLPIVAMLRNCGCDCNTTLTAIVSAGGVVNNISTRVVKD